MKEGKLINKINVIVEVMGHEVVEKRVSNPKSSRLGIKDDTCDCVMMLMISLMTKMMCCDNFYDLYSTNEMP